jgi:ribosomal subunit interface protein
MKITVTGRQIELTTSDRARIRRQAERLKRPLGSAALSTQIAVARDGVMHVCEVTLHVRGDHIFHAKGRDKLVPVAVGQAVEKAAAQAKKLSDRWKTRRKGNGA